MVDFQSDDPARGIKEVVEKLRFSVSGHFMEESEVDDTLKYWTEPSFKIMSVRMTPEMGMERSQNNSVGVDIKMLGDDPILSLAVTVTPAGDSQSSTDEWGGGKVVSDATSQLVNRVEIKNHTLSMLTNSYFHEGDAVQFKVTSKGGKEDAVALKISNHLLRGAPVTGAFITYLRKPWKIQPENDSLQALDEAGAFNSANSATAMTTSAVPGGNGSGEGDSTDRLQGELYDIEKGGKQTDEKLAISWYEKAAAKGDILAEYELAEAYFAPFPVSGDEQQGRYWMQKAADQGYAPAEESLGKNYLHGFYHFEKDEQKAIFWYLKAANQGSGDAQFQLGMLYYRGENNHAEGLKWLEKSAAQGYPLAKYAIKTLNASP